MKTYRLAITYWNAPRDVSIIDAENAEEAMLHLLDRIDAGAVMSFTVEGV